MYLCFICLDKTCLRIVIFRNIKVPIQLLIYCLSSVNSKEYWCKTFSDYNIKSTYFETNFNTIDLSIH